MGARRVWGCVAVCCALVAGCETGDIPAVDQPVMTQRASLLGPVVEPSRRGGAPLRRIEIETMRLQYGRGSEALDPDARLTLEAMARWLRAHPGFTLTLIGHADERRTRAANRALGAARAAGARAYLLTRRVSPERLSVVTRGDRELIVKQTSASAEGKKRRVTFQLTRHPTLEREAGGVVSR